MKLMKNNAASEYCITTEGNYRKCFKDVRWCWSCSTETANPMGERHTFQRKIMYRPL